MIRRLLLPGLLGFLVLGAVGAVVWPGGSEVSVDVPPGLSAGQTARLLRREGVLREVLVFRIFGKATGLDRTLKPGRYTLRRGMAPFKALLRLHQGKVDHEKVVVPEGFMARQIADRLEAAGVTPAAPFMAYVRANNLEGFLFPTTYLFSRGLTPEAVAHHMHAEFKRAVAPEFKASAQTRYTLDQVVALASIVQREAALTEEMPTIAAVYLNRLRKRMRLEADPTVQYALGKETGVWKKGLTYKDLKLSSPYNTYQRFGLPPGPICSPGVLAVRAVLRPAATDAIYFVADNSGGHTFSTNLRDHLAAKERAKRERKKIK